MSEVMAVDPCKLSPYEEVNEGSGMLGKERWEEVRRMHAEGRLLSQIARETHLDRKTVRRCLRQDGWKPYGRSASTPTLLAAHLGWLAERAAQVRFSARILFQEPRATRDYRGGYDTVRNAVRPLRVEALAASLTQCRFETAPGQQSQVDWGQVRVPFASGPVATHIFVLIYIAFCCGSEWKNLQQRLVLAKSWQSCAVSFGLFSTRMTAPFDALVRSAHGVLEAVLYRGPAHPRTGQRGGSAETRRFGSSARAF